MIDCPGVKVDDVLNMLGAPLKNHIKWFLLSMIAIIIQVLLLIYIILYLSNYLDIKKVLISVCNLIWMRMLNGDPPPAPHRKNTPDITLLFSEYYLI